MTLQIASSYPQYTNNACTRLVKTGIIWAKAVLVTPALVSITHQNASSSQLILLPTHLIKSTLLISLQINRFWQSSSSLDSWINKNCCLYIDNCMFPRYLPKKMWKSQRQMETLTSIKIQMRACTPVCAWTVDKPIPVTVRNSDCITQVI